MSMVYSHRPIGRPTTSAGRPMKSKAAALSWERDFMAERAEGLLFVKRSFSHTRRDFTARSC